MVGQRFQGRAAAEMSKCHRCGELFRSVLRSVQAIKLWRDSVCKNAKKLFSPEFFDSPTYQFEQDGIDSSAAPQPGATSLDYGLGDIDNMDDCIFFDPEYCPLTIESIGTGLTYPTNLESTNLELQTELSWFDQTGEPFYDASPFTPHPLNGELPLLHEQRTAMYGTDETVPALLPPPEPNYEVVALPNCNTSGSPAVMLQTSTFNWRDQISGPQNYQDLTSFLWQTIDAGPPYDRLVEFEQVAEGDDWYIPQVPQTQARRLGWCAIINMVRACKIFLSRVRSRMVRILPHPSKSFCLPYDCGDFELHKRF